jgi:hypothetical protein
VEDGLDKMSEVDEVELAELDDHACIDEGDLYLVFAVFDYLIDILLLSITLSVQLLLYWVFEEEESVIMNYFVDGFVDGMD